MAVVGDLHRDVPCHPRVFQQWRDINVICGRFFVRRRKVVCGEGYLEDEQQAGAGGSGGVELEASLGLENVNVMQLPIFLYHA
jgi:hypothetical protein